MKLIIADIVHVISLFIENIESFNKNNKKNDNRIIHYRFNSNILK